MLVRVRFALSGLAALAGAIVLSAGCGARSGLEPCLRDEDCANADLCATYKCLYDETIHNKSCQVQHKTNCDDGDPCTDDSCDPHTGACVNTAATQDLDGDGHHPPKPGFEPGAPGSCGDDCDDTDPRAFLGAKEVCDGVDNDCDGVVDNGATYVPQIGAEFQVSKPGFDWAEPETFVRAGTAGLLSTYGASLTGQYSPYVQPMDGAGQPNASAALLTGTVALGSNTTSVWTGDRFGMAWSDRRDGNYEIYFSLFDPTGKKMAPGDERITVSKGFSLFPSIAWTGQEFVIVWQEETSSADFKIQGQRLDLQGRLICNIATMTTGAHDDQGAVIAAGRTGLGLSWVRQDNLAQTVVFQPFAFDLTATAAQPTTVTTPAIDGNAPRIAYDRKNDRYVLAFFDPSPSKRVVYGAIAGPNGGMVVPAKDVSQTPLQARDAAIFAFGDRVLFVYADNRDQNSGYELYEHELSADLGSELSPPKRVTVAPNDSIEPIISFAADGTVLVLFRDDRGPNPAVFETGLKCVMP